MTVKVGAIGSGGMAGGHFQNLDGFDDVEFAAFCDISEERAVDRCNEYGGNPYTNYKQMLDNEVLDAVYICTPPFAHGKQELAVCQRQIPIFVEKPIATCMDVARTINQAIQDYDIISSVGYHWRYQGNVDHAKSALADQKVVGALGYWMGGMPDVAWWRVREQSGGQHVEQTTHIFDLCRYLVNSEVVAVYGLAAQGSMTDIPDYDVDDMSVVNISFANGVVANITSACMLKDWGRVKLELFSNGLVVDISGGSVNINRDGQIEEFTNKINGYAHEDRVFIDAVKNGDTSKIRAPYNDALKTLELTLAASQSFETGQIVNLDSE